MGENDVNVAEYKVGNVTVRIHGDPPPREVLEEACIRFLRGIEKEKGREVMQRVMCKSVSASGSGPAKG